MPTENPPATLAAPTLLHPTGLDQDAVQQARIDLAACFREAARIGLHEGICNHFSAMVPGSDQLFLVNPYGWSFNEITASRLLVCDFGGGVLSGAGRPEETAFFIHARVHKNRPRARVVFHTHMPNATALAMLEGPPLVWAGQTALKFHGRTVIDEGYNGLALDEAEGDRIAASMGDAEIVFMRNHGVMVVGPTIAAAWDDLYYLERACEVQRLALSTGRPFKAVPEEVAARTARQMNDPAGEAAHLHLESVKRNLDRVAPDYRH